jgi:hypothetical protein
MATSNTPPAYKCAVVTDGKECGLDLSPTEQVALTGLHECAVGHRTHFLPVGPSPAAVLD